MSNKISFTVIGERIEKEIKVVTTEPELIEAVVYDITSRGFTITVTKPCPNSNSEIN